MTEPKYNYYESTITNKDGTTKTYRKRYKVKYNKIGRPATSRSKLLKLLKDIKDEDELAFILKICQKIQKE